MSYSFSGTAVDGEITEWSATPQAGYAEEESKADLEQARDVAEQMARYVGGTVAISGGGHANPGRTPDDGWATDGMTVSVTRQKT